MIFLITAAGEGSRFYKDGITVPKPLIRVHGKTLLEHSIESLSIHDDDIIAIVTQARHQVKRCLSDRFPVNTIWLETESLLEGQLQTAHYAASELLNSYCASPSSSLLVHNCDTQFQWNDSIVPSPVHYASMPVFEANGDHWSFGRPSINDPMLAIEISEKVRISSLASIGFYGFYSLYEFRVHSRKYMDSEKTALGEYYIAPFLNYGIKLGRTVSLPRVEEVRCFGTPAELCKTFGISEKEFLSENTKF